MRKLLKKENVCSAISDVCGAFNRQLSKKGSQKLVSTHEILGIVAEEYHELIGAVTNNSTPDVKEELIDIAVACLLGVASIKEGVDW
jgi:hypothetical protein